MSNVSDYQSNGELTQRAWRFLNFLQNEIAKKFPDEKFSLRNHLKLSEVLEIGEKLKIADLNLRRQQEAAERAAKNIENPHEIKTIVVIKGITDELESWDFSIFGDTFSEVYTSISKTGEGAIERVVSLSGKVFDAGEDLVEGVSEGVSSASKWIKALPLIGVALIFILIVYRKKILSTIK